MGKRGQCFVPPLLGHTYSCVVSLPDIVIRYEQLLLNAGIGNVDSLHAVAGTHADISSGPTTKTELQNTYRDVGPFDHVFVVEHVPFSVCNTALVHDTASFEAVVLRAVKTLQSKREASNNVLRWGAPGGHDAAAGRSPNAALEHLHGQPCWRALHRRLGSAALHHLLVHCSIFVHLPSSSTLLQVAGYAFAGVAQKRRQGSTPGGASAAAPSGVSGGPASSVLTRSLKRKRAAGDTLPRGKADGRMAQFARCAAAALRQSEESVAPPKRCRVHSWKRRKLKAQRAAQQAAAQQPGAQRGGHPSAAPRHAPPSAGRPASDAAAAGTNGAGHTAGVTTATAASGAPGKTRDCRRGTGPAFHSVWPSKLKLPRQACFFCAEFPPRAGLPRSHPVAALAPCRDSARDLVGAIWGSTAPLSAETVCKAGGYRVSAASSVRLSPPQQQRMLVIAEELLMRARRVPWHALLEAHCPCPDLNQSPHAQHASERHAAGRASHAGRAVAGGPSGGSAAVQGKARSLPLGRTGTGAVCGFMCAVLSRLLPVGLLGGRGAPAQRALLRHVCKFVALRRFEQMTVQDVMHGIRTTGIGWLDVLEMSGHRARSHTVRQQHVGLLVWWIFGALVTPIIRSFFYVTETQPLKWATVYYRKPVWRELERRSIACLIRSIYSPISVRAALRMLASSSLGMTRLRHLPKRSGMRPVANLSCKTAVRVPQRLRAGGRCKRHRPAGTVTNPICIDADTIEEPPCDPPERKRVKAYTSAAPLPASLAFEPINRVLQPTYAALKAEAQHAARCGAADSPAAPAPCRPPVCEACGACLCGSPATAPAAPKNTVFSGSVPSYGEAHWQLREFASAWRAAGQPPLTALSFDVAKAFDNVDVAKVKLLLEEAVVASPGWEVHRAKETVHARGRVVTKYRTYAVPQLGNTAAADSHAAQTAHLSTHRTECSDPAPTAAPPTADASHSPPHQRGSALAALHGALMQPSPAGRAACAPGQQGMLGAAHGDVSPARAGVAACDSKAALPAVSPTAAAHAACTARAIAPAGDALEPPRRSGVGASRVVADCGRRSTLSLAEFWRQLEAHLGGSLVKLRSQCGAHAA